MRVEFSTRQATQVDIPFLSRIEYEASLPPFDHCFWEDLLQGTQTSALEFIEAVLKAEAGNWGNVVDFLILEAQGKPVAAAAGYTPNTEDYRPLRLSGLDEIARNLGWSVQVTAAFRDRYEEFWGVEPQPIFLSPQAPWIIENVAVLPESRGQGFGKVLLKALLEKGRSQQYSHAGIMVINGNDVARHTYESIGFKLYQVFSAEYFSAQFDIEFPGLTKFGFSFN